MKTIGIIGGGLSGLAAGVYGQKAGYRTIIFELNQNIGGCCCSWTRGDYAIDNCIHWLMGTKKGTKQNDFWREIGALSDDVPIYERNSFYSSELEGKVLTLWRDPERSRKEFLEHSPADEEEINSFFDCVFTCRTVLDSAQGTFDLKAVLSDISADVSKAKVLKDILRYIKKNLKQWAPAFTDPLIRKMILDFSAGEYEAFWLVLSYAMFTSGGADVPVGGSGQMSERIAEYYLSLGGEIRYGAEAVKVEFAPTSSDTASGIRFKDGTFEKADYVICTTSLPYTFTNLLDKKYAPAALKRLEDHEKITAYSAFQCAFAVDGEMSEIDDLFYFQCEPFEIGCSMYDRIGVKNYRKFGEFIAPPGKTVVQCMFIQHIDDFRFWSALSKDRENYSQRKKETVDAIMERIIKRFPEYEGRFHQLDCWTPASYANILNAANGQYMRYITKPLSTLAMISHDLPKVKNVFIAGHALFYPGGTPMAAFSGKHVISRIKKHDQRNQQKNDIG
ncbi:MAG: NAD(P)/FAD-dependent oxidoreductase [Lachnospiraceae bacterium]|nr:NAD(P)/FAD-dependent oxidoreductase [Lachnospiraceae bacterium]